MSEIKDIPRRFLAKIISGNRVTVDKDVVAAWNMQEGESYILEVVRRVEVDA
jgi:hypothetical protein